MFWGSKIAVAFVGFLHLGFLVLEMFLWSRPQGRRVFRMTEQKARETAALAANQGLYNGFLAAGLFWSALNPDPLVGRQLGLFFLGCVLVAGVFGAATASRSILFVQALPAALALLVLFFA